jgi:hypothetical protein
MVELMTLRLKWESDESGAYLGRSDDGHVAAIGQYTDGRYFVNVVREGAYVWQGYANDVRSGMAAAEAVVVVRAGDTVEVSPVAPEAPATITFSLVTEQAAPAQPSSGRDALADAHQAALDLVALLRHAIYERDGR